ncbi:hypothetical protein MCAG_00399 [Micromonospora sp. ATCC 39149]|uniref:hypothetical protein n=1 Tax=Micromonospora sp. (strain ATCC 39149 / NRRL 15099 / SCC 1413) TaxID=219305 RepID=UPI0001A50F64|nr:hypothetical protein [Micromonospora sp. ATCC 39149]EEP70072.1 hypothetical protein MCAG_00399 [Micromonospora sp. ATCC 39149]
MAAWRTVAARDNADWCDLVCRAHGLAGAYDADAWSVPRRSPPWYPDAVTLRPGVDAARLLARIDTGPGASVKDSFADLDLTPYGFRVLFSAEWIHRPATAAPGGVALAPVDSARGLARWAAAHGNEALSRPALLADSRITFLARHDGDGALTGGGVLTDTGQAVGVSNIFASDGDLAGVWRGVVAACPGRPLVGYEPGGGLPPAEDAGFRSAGPLRVWLRPDAPDAARLAAGGTAAGTLNPTAGGNYP